LTRVLAEASITRQYAQEFGWDTAFAANANRVGARLIENYDHSCERIFIAESVSTSSFLGSIALIKHRTDPKVAQIRLLLVDPSARGMGLGAKLINECVRFARGCSNNTDKEAGGGGGGVPGYYYEKIVLRTYTVLEGARRLYTRAGFKVVSTGDEQDLWGSTLTCEVWQLSLSDKSKGEREG
jgi:GNAT superfamily N-acetyltransferase